jgi:hypothetical protein
MKIEDLFEESQLTQLRDLIRRRMKASENALDKEMKEMLKTQREGGPEFHPRPEKLELENLEGFSISDRGVTFIYDYGYAHVVQALEPSGDFFIPISQLKSFIRRDGLLARFIR